MSYPDASQVFEESDMHDMCFSRDFLEDELATAFEELDRVRETVLDFERRLEGAVSPVDPALTVLTARWTRLAHEALLEALRSHDSVVRRIERLGHIFGPSQLIAIYDSTVRIVNETTSSLDRIGKIVHEKTDVRR